MPSGHVDRTTLRPLSGHALDVLRILSLGPEAAHTINPGVRHRLYREGLIEIPPGKSLVRITDAGRAALGQS